MKDFQITVVVMTMLMSLSMMELLPKKVARNPVANHSRWLMAVGLALVGVQFLIQYIGGYRNTDVVKAILINIAFFIPCSALLSLSILNLQRQGKLKPIEKWIAVPTWLVAMLLLISAIPQKQPISGNPSGMFWAEIVASALYCMMQMYYSFLQFKEVRRMKEVLENFYDSRRDELLTWMRTNVVFVAWMAIFVPIIIFSARGVLMGFGILLFFGLFYQWFCFCRCVISGEARTMSKAEEGTVNEQKEVQELSNNRNMLSEEIRQRVEKAVNVWIDRKGYLRKGITSPDAAKEMKLRRYQLSSWIKESGCRSFSNWITTLRVNHAKELLAAHREWSNETIADHCGISLSHFQKVFREQTGMTPAQYLQTL